MNYANFKGLTSKSTYWWAVLFVILADMAVRIAFPGHDEMMSWMGMPFSVHGDSNIYNLWSLATALPSISLLVRRLKDTGRSGANALFLLLPVIGWILLLIWTLEQSKTNSAGTGAA